MITDGHNHTKHFSPDAGQTIEELISEAVSKGFSRIGITEHYELDYPEDGINWMFDIDEYIKCIPSWREKAGKNLDLLMGIEFGYQTQVAKEIDRIASSYPFDVVLLSNHLFRGKDFYVDRECYKLPKKELHKEYIGIMAEMCEKCSNYDVAAHYDYINRYSDNLDSFVLYEDCPAEFDRMFEALITKGKALEINTKSIWKHKERGFRSTLPDPAKYPAKVDALITSQWGQDAPYSYWCPTGYGEICEDYTPDVVHCCVGCVATALAQIVRYYRFPDHAAGTANFLIGNKEASDSFDATFDWDNMLDTYPEGQYTEAQGRAVALLSYVCGLVSWMNYATNESGSSNLAAVAGAQNYFGYSKDASTVVRSDYSEPDWMDMVYNELSHRRPLYYQGVHLNFNPSTGLVAAGHSFVIDGYNELGMVHVNWGQLRWLL